MKLLTKKIVLGSSIIGSLSIAGASSLLVLKQNSELKDFEANIQKIAKLSKTYNFEHPELYKHTLTLAKEILRISLNSTSGFADLSKTSIAHNFNNSHSATIKEISNFFSEINNNSQFNSSLEQILESNFYNSFGFDLNPDESINTKNKLKDWLINVNKDYILKMSNTNLLNPLKIAKQFNSKKLIDFYFFDDKNNKYISIDDYINSQSFNSDTLITIKKFIKHNKHMLINYKLPKDLLIKANATFKTNELNFGSIPNTTTINADYDPGNSIKTTASLWNLTIFKSKHADSFKYAPFIPIFYDYKKYKGIYLSDYAQEFKKWLSINSNVSNVPEIKRGTLFERFQSGRPLYGHNSNFDILQYNKNNNYYYDWNKSHVPLNTVIYNDKLHISQSSEFGSVPIYGHDFGEYDSSKNIANLDYGINEYSADQYNCNLLNWQYIRRLITWGRNNRVYSIPKGSVTDLAHKNGALSLGTIYINDWKSLNFWLYKSGDKYPYIDNIMKIAKDYGFDGWFLNWEPVTLILDHSYNERILEMNSYLRRKAFEEGIQIDNYANLGASNNFNLENYDSIRNVGLPNNNGLYYFNFDKNGNLLLDEKHIPRSGAMHTYFPYISMERLSLDQIRPLTQGKINYYRTLYEKYNSLGYKPITFQLYYMNRTNSVNNWFNFFYDMQQTANNKHPNSEINKNEWWGDVEHFGYYTDYVDDPNWIGTPRVFFSIWEHEKYWGVGKFGDPRTYKNENSSAYSKYFQESSVINGERSFSTNFNLSNTKFFFINGQKQNFKLVQAQGLQDIMPTYRFINDLYNENGTLVDWASDDYTRNTINQTFNDNDAYFGGNSIQYNGNLGAKQTLVNRLFSSNIKLSETNNFEIIYKGSLTPKLVTWENWNQKHKIIPSNITNLENGWKKATFNPSGNYNVKYFGISLKNNGQSQISLENNFLLGGMTWNKNNDTDINPFDNINNEYAHEYYNYVNKKVSINLNTGTTNPHNDITYVVKELYEENGITKEKVVDVTRNNMTRIDRVDFAYQNATNGMPYVKLSVDAYNKNGNKLGNHKYWIQLHHDHEILPIDDDGTDKTSPLGIVQDPNAIPSVSDDYFTSKGINLEQINLGYVDDNGYVKDGDFSVYNKLNDKQKIFLKFLAKKLIDLGYKTGFIGLIELMILTENKNTNLNKELIDKYLNLIVNYNPRYDEDKRQYKLTIINTVNNSDTSKEVMDITRHGYDLVSDTYNEKGKSHSSGVISQRK